MSGPAELLRFAVEHSGSPSFACQEHGYGCEAYHTTSPLLHHIGFFQSYERYPLTIRSAVAAMPGATVAVAGVESELSAEALLRALPPEPHRVTFFDRCETPLRRTAARAAQLAGHDVATVSGDFLQHELGGRFDVVFADSFIKQFRSADKPRALARLASAARTSGSLIVMREYIGELGSLLRGFWTALPDVLERSGVPADRRLRAALEDLRGYMSGEPATYRDDAALRAALTGAGLRVRSYERSAGKPYAIVVASPSRDLRAQGRAS